MAVENFRERDYVRVLRVNAGSPRLLDRPILLSSRQPDTTERRVWTSSPSSIKSVTLRAFGTEGPR
jgi:hypothetical protein